MRIIKSFALISAITSLLVFSGCNEAQELADDATRSYNKLSDEVTNTKENVEGTIQDVTDTVDSAKKTVDDTVNTVKNTAESISDTAGQVKDQADDVSNNF